MMRKRNVLLNQTQGQKSERKLKRKSKEEEKEIFSSPFTRLMNDPFKVDEKDKNLTSGINFFD
jgi:hypothetical protein